MPTADQLLSADEAAALLGVKKATLYTYVSRGLLRRVQGNDGRTRRYLRDDVLRLKERSSARSGQAAVAIEASRWGQPVLDTAIAELDQGRVSLRGHALSALIGRGATFESITALLWEEEADTDWPVPDPPPSHIWAAQRRLDRLSLAIAADAAQDLLRFGAQPAAERLRARRLCRVLACAAAPSPEQAARAADAGSVAAVLSVAFSGSAALAPQLDRALCCCAEHGLDVSTYAARVTASTGADLHASLLAGLAALSGPSQAGTCDRIAAWLRGLAMDPMPPEVVIGQQLARGEAIPGFSDDGTPGNDPRASLLLSAARAADRTGGVATQLVDAVTGAAEARGYPPPGLALALVALCQSLSLPGDAAATILAVARVAGWTAHIQEQRTRDGVIQPRGRYTGPAASL